MEVFKCVKEENQCIFSFNQCMPCVICVVVKFSEVGGASNELSDGVVVLLDYAGVGRLCWVDLEQFLEPIRKTFKPVALGVFVKTTRRVC